MKISWKVGYDEKHSVISSECYKFLQIIWIIFILLINDLFSIGNTVVHQGSI